MANAARDPQMMAVYSRPTRHRVVPGDSRLVMFFRLNGEVWTEVFALVAGGVR
jgi:hypothetical protein